MKTFAKTAITAVVIISALGFYSCRKDTTCVAKIRCKDANGNVVSGAQVNLFAMVENANQSKFRADIQASGTTDNSGFVTFSFKLPAVFDINATATTYTAAGIIKLEEGKTTSKELILQ